MTAYKAGLHKKISSIFDGMPVQKEQETPAPAKPSLPGFMTEQTEAPVKKPYPSVQMPPPPPQPDYSKTTAKPVQKLYKDTAEKSVKLVSKAPSRLDSGLIKIYQTIKAKLLPAKAVPYQKRQVAALALIPVLVVVLIVIVVKFIIPSAPPPAPDSPKPPLIPPVSVVKINWEIPQPISPGLRDPMKPVYASIVTIPVPTQTKDTNKVENANIETAAHPEIVVSAIVYSPETPLTSIAVIGTKTMHVGEKIGDVLIKEITADAVIFEWKGQTKSLEVKQSWIPVDQIQ